MLDVVIATRNRHKVKELTSLLRVPGIRWHALTEFPEVGAIRETGKTFKANAVRKARAVARATSALALADDSGVEVDALGGAPGIRSARFAGAHGNDQANNDKLLRALRGLPVRRRGARYRCVLALASPTRLIARAHGTWRGRVAERPKGRRGFGYDPIFVVPRFGKTVGELSGRLKARLSHRAQAARRLRPVLERLARRARTTGTGRRTRGSRSRAAA